MTDRTTVLGIQDHQETVSVTTTPHALYTLKPMDDEVIRLDPSDAAEEPILRAPKSLVDGFRVAHDATMAARDFTVNKTLEGAAYTGAQVVEELASTEEVEALAEALQHQNYEPLKEVIAEETIGAFYRPEMITPDQINTMDGRDQFYAYMQHNRPSADISVGFKMSWGGPARDKIGEFRINAEGLSLRAKVNFDDNDVRVSARVPIDLPVGANTLKVNLGEYNF